MTAKLREGMFLLCPLVLAFALGPVLCGQVQAADCEETKNLSPKELVQFLRTNADTADPQCLTDAINKLGSSRPQDKLSIEVLIKLLDFRRPETEREKMHIVSMRDWFPAVEALVSTGTPAVQPVIAHLKSNEMTETARHNAIRALLYIYGGEPPQAVAALRKAAQETETQVEAVTLETCAKDAAKLCAKMFEKDGKSRCEAALGQKLED